VGIAPEVDLSRTRTKVNGSMERYRDIKTGDKSLGSRVSETHIASFKMRVGSAKEH
jgi:hypothetical protein